MTSSNPTAVFVVASGQHDNLGDSILRRGYLDALRTIAPLDAWVAGSGPAFVRGLGLRSGDRATGRISVWAVRALARLRRGPVVLALNAGEFTFTRRNFVTSVVLLPLAYLVRWRGGSIVWLGAAAPTRKRWLDWPYVRLAKLATVAAWREAGTLETLGRRSLMPDWALSESLRDPAPSRADADRRYIAISFRGDRPAPTEAWLSALSTCAANLGLEILVVPQVARDQQLGRELADALGVAMVPWPEGVGHDEQEAVVRNLYRQAQVVVSNRLHALLVGMSEGAVPLGWIELDNGKLRRHFDSLDLGWVMRTGDDGLASLRALTASELEGYRRQVEERRVRAAEEIEQLRETLTASVGAASGGGRP